jgi:tRNA-dihydrouridine synthase 1
MSEPLCKIKWRSKKRAAEIELEKYDEDAVKSDCARRRIRNDSRYIKEHPRYTYILAPMVGASELAFRLLCRKYGAQLCYTPMMSSAQFADSDTYRAEYFGSSHQVHIADHPAYAHVYANTVSEFVSAAKQAVKMGCDGIDLNLGCPQRAAFIGHYGSYLCTEDPATHEHVALMLTSAVRAIQNQIPVTAKIRLLHPTQAQCTLNLCQTLHANGRGATEIAIHARQRASWKRIGPGARDGPADLHQVAAIVREIHSSVNGACSQLRVITNGNTTTFENVVDNLNLTAADGIMSAEGLLDNPALFLPRYGPMDYGETTVTVWTLKKPYRYIYSRNVSADDDDDNFQTVGGSDAPSRETLLRGKIDKISKQLASIEEQLDENQLGTISESIVRTLVEKRGRRQRKLKKLERKLQKASGTSGSFAITPLPSNSSDQFMEFQTVSLQSLYEIANDKVQLAMEYLDLATVFPTTIRTVIFHIRRMCKAELVQYQLLQECLSSTSLEQIRVILIRIMQYRLNPETFVFDIRRAQEEKDALDRQRREEGKRKAFEERMIRKAKREGKEDLHHYLKIGAELPSVEQLKQYSTLSQSDLLNVWKQNHSQHCMAYHMDPRKCARGRSCAFLHVDHVVAGSSNVFRERDECAG